jgi:hypothetical protein
MKMIFTCCVLLLLASCFSRDNSNRETDQLNWRITILEQRLDSLTNSRNTNPFGLNNKNNQDAVSYGPSPANWRCHAITKKGTQCKRTAKNNSYCWQHGGWLLDVKQKAPVMIKERHDPHHRKVMLLLYFKLKNLTDQSAAHIKRDGRATIKLLQD